jgi:hypothetical protein
MFQAKQDVKRVQIEVQVIRRDGNVDDLGVVSDSAWYWRRGPGKWLADRRIRRANRRIDA